VQAEAIARPRLQRSNFAREIFETLILIVLVYTLVNLATVRFYIDGPSMQPTFFAGQFLIVSRVNYLLDQPQRGDIVVFNAPGSREEDPPLIKRVIGMPGETLELRDGQVYVDGNRVDEPYVREACQTFRCENHVYPVLGSDEYFLMGDNRNNSRDSRAFGAVNLNRFVGEAVLRYWPPSEWGLITGNRYSEE
jgi:signal peptidase I